MTIVTANTLTANTRELFHKINLCCSFASSLHGPHMQHPHTGMFHYNTYIMSKSGAWYDRLVEKISTDLDSTDFNPLGAVC